MTDNFDKIASILKFDSEDDFYYLQILQRKKENKELGSNSRVIRNYYINSVDHLMKRKEEIVRLCEVFNARASIRLNRRSYSKVAFKAMQNLANTMSNREYKFVGKSYDRACGQCHNDPDKTWILDIDGRHDAYFTDDITHFIGLREPIGDKFIAEIPSKNGVHLIVKPFNLTDFKEFYPDVEIHKDNPTNLYII
jgi:hypothetical protein